MFQHALRRQPMGCDEGTHSAFHGVRLPATGCGIRGGICIRALAFLAIGTVCSARAGLPGMPGGVESPRGEAATELAENEQHDENGYAGTATEQPTQLEQITVTATKRQAAPRSLPQTITAISGTELEARGDGGLRDVLRSQPGVQMTELQPDSFRIAFRGIQTDSGGNVPSAAGLFIDDVPFNDPFLNQVRPDLALFDLERIEILKGPQGTLFGGSALAGAVRYSLRDAVPGRWEVRTFAQYQDVEDGSPNRVGGFIVNAPLHADDLALRLVGVRSLYGGTIDDERNGVEDTDRYASYSGRAMLRWDAGDAFTVSLRALRQRNNSDDVPFAETTDGGPTRERALLSRSPSTTQFELYGLDVDYEFSWATLHSGTNVVRKESELSTAYGERLLGAEDGGTPIGLPTTADVTAFFQEVRLVSTDASSGGLQWLGGVYLHRYKSDSGQKLLVDPFGEATELFNFDADVEAREIAAFGEVSKRFLDRWTATLGLRFYSIDTDGESVTSGAIVAPPGETRNDADIRRQGVNPRLALEVALTDSVRSYVSMARGFRFGGIQINGPSVDNPDAPRTYAPDSLWNYELGVRSDWFGRRLSADAAVFYIDWDDPQVQTSTTDEVPLNIIDNVGGARSYGAELTVRWEPAQRGAYGQMSAAYTNARTTSSFIVPGGQEIDDGTRLPGHSESQVFARLGYSWLVSSFGLDASLSHSYNGKGTSDLSQTIDLYDYHTTDLRLMAEQSGWPGSPMISLAVLNVSDERAVVSAFALSEENFMTIYNRPRTLDIRLQLSF